MCWKYEEQYTQCFDFIFKDIWWEDKEGLDALMRNWDVKINNHLEYQKAFFNFLSYCHENKIIEPAEITKEIISQWMLEEKILKVLPTDEANKLRDNPNYISDINTLIIRKKEIK